MAIETQPQDDELLTLFVVPRELVKCVKDALEIRKVADASRKIRPVSAEAGDPEEYKGKFVISSIFPFNGGEDLDFLQSQGLLDQVGIIAQPRALIPDKTLTSALKLAVQDWYRTLEDGSILQVGEVKLIQELPPTYSIYGPLLMLPQHAFQTETWQSLLESMNADQNRALFEAISKRMNVSHIATNAPIPLRNLEHENIVRSPTNLTPLFGDFGKVCTAGNPTQEDFDAAFWCHTKQNGITQFWAPRYTMFSRGNITEKARVLKMPSVAAVLAQTPKTGCCAVDLYAGIGYFTFSYLAAGVTTVLGWDLNPWSIEGLRRGAIANKWSVDVYQNTVKTEDVSLSEQKRLMAFVESNEFALARIERLRDSLPPIRHVNCGLLPTSKGSYGTAAAALDPSLGGWAHVHENFAVSEIEEKSENVRLAFEHLVQNLDERRNSGCSSQPPPRKVVLEHVQRVKSYAPGVFHCVVDLVIPPVLQG